MKKIEVYIPIKVFVGEDGISFNAEDLSEDAVKNELAEICERVHASCDNDCPVYDVNGCVPDENKTRSGCDCFKNGKAMLEFLQKSLKK